jgi:hypothetical protein
LRAAPAVERQRCDDVEQRLIDRISAVIALEADDRDDEARLHAVVGCDAPDHFAVLGQQRSPALDPLRAHAAQIGFIRLHELGLRAVLRDGLAMDADRRQHGVQRLGADAAFERRSAHLAEEGLESGVLGRSIDLRCRTEDEPPRQGQADDLESLHALNDTGRASGKARSFL